MSNDEVSVTTDNHGNPISLKIYGTPHPIAEVIDAVQKRPMWKMQSEALGVIADVLDIPRWETDPVRTSDAVQDRNAALERIADLLCVPGWQVEPSRLADAVERLYAAVQRVRVSEAPGAAPQTIELEMPFIRAALAPEPVTGVEQIASAIRAMRRGYEDDLQALHSAAYEVLRAQRDADWAEQNTRGCSFALRQAVRGLVADRLAQAHEDLTRCLGFQQNGAEANLEPVEEGEPFNAPAD